MTASSWPLVAIGILLIGLSLLQVRTGRAFLAARLVSREQPFRFWFLVGLQALIGLFFIAGGTFT